MKIEEMTERDVLTSTEYSEIQRHEYRGIPFFTALYTRMNHIILEPIHVEILDALNKYTFPWNLNNDKLWCDSGTAWARNLSLQEQRDRLIAIAYNDIDSILDGTIIKDLEESYQSTRNTLETQRLFFKELSEAKQESKK